MIMETSVKSFTHFYYASGLYRHDYEEVLGRELPEIYHVEKTWPNYERLRARINERYAEWSRLKTLLQGTSEVPAACRQLLTVAA